ncbi:hypothetical protein BHM03_00007472 [Ensete ventricosum]|nr:hypothetical protein BHM03_00007472 [Ensete ventricosum]
MQQMLQARLRRQRAAVAQRRVHLPELLLAHYSLQAYCSITFVTGENSPTVKLLHGLFLCAPSTLEAEALPESTETFLYDLGLHFHLCFRRRRLLRDIWSRNVLIDFCLGGDRVNI